MIDYTGSVAYSKPLAHRLSENPLWPKKEAKGTRAGNLTIKRVSPSGRIEIQGSLHYYRHNHNWNDFTYPELVETIDDICSKLEIEPQQFKLTNLEFGVNLPLDFDPSDFLKGLILYKDESFDRIKPSSGHKGICMTATKNHYLIKIYEKDKQRRILRFEAHYRKMKALNSLGIASLADLKKVDKLVLLGKLLLDFWNEVIIIEPLDLTLLTDPERKQYQRAVNPREWSTLNRKQRCDLKRKYHALIEKYAGGGRKKEFERMMRNKWEQLMQNGKTGNVLTDEQKTGNVLTDRQQLKTGNILTNIHDAKTGNVLTGPKEQAKEHFDRLGKEVKCSPRILCPITGRDISHQQKGSKFVSAKTVEQRPDLAEELDDGRRRHRRKHDDISEAERLAKRVRNKDSNPRNNRRRTVGRKYGNESQLLIMPLEEMLSEETKNYLAYFKGTQWEVRQ
jgi:hypothetical protein